MDSPKSPGVFEMVFDPSKASKYLSQMNAVEECSRNMKLALMGVSLVLKNEEVLFSFPQKREAGRVFSFLALLSNGTLFVTKKNLLCWGRLPENYERVCAEFDVIKNIEQLALQRIDKILLASSGGKPNDGAPLFPVEEESFKKFPPEIIILRGAV